MALLQKTILRFERRKGCNLVFLERFLSSQVVENALDGQEFPKLDLMDRDATSRGRKPRATKGDMNPYMLPPRYKRMAVDQHWPSVWPTAASFRPSSVPLPLHMGVIETGEHVDKFTNVELLKIPNFLHLTPPAIKEHCAAIKKFCTAWPEALKDREGFPVEVITSDYCHASPSIRDHKSRIVTLKIKLCDLELDARARDKLIRLLQDKYHKETDTMVLVSDRCPMRKQNLDYVKYLLTALYHESRKHEAWEDELMEVDWLHFRWEGSQAQQRLLNIIQVANPGANKEELLEKQTVKNYGDALTELINNREEEETLKKYKETLLPLLRLKPWPSNEL